jgi:hypothetical protein
MKRPSLEEIDGEGITGFYKQLIAQFGGKCTISEETLARYDLNIVSHMRKINDKRVEPMVLKYFQYLSLLFVEYYLDKYFNDRQDLIDGLTAYITDFNAQYPNDSYEPYEAKDLNKIAVWNATGSGKTLIMHINYYQYMHYSGGKLPDDATYILLTPKEGLSLQHIEDYADSGITARIYDKATSRWTQSANEISVLENTKLGDKDQDTVVSVKRFGSRNVVFLDGGQLGSTSGKDGKLQKYATSYVPTVFPLSIRRPSGRRLHPPMINHCRSDTPSASSSITPTNISTATATARITTSSTCRTTATR